MQLKDLQEILELKQQEVEAQKKIVGQAFLRKEAEKMGLKKSLKNKLCHNIKSNKFNIIAEIKNFSPSYSAKQKFILSELALAYEIGGADCIAINTDDIFFKGNKEDLKKITNYTDLPILDKDIIVSNYQIYQSAYLGADAILIRAGLLDFNKLSDYTLLARELGLDVVIKVNSITELQKTIEIPNAITCINTRYSLKPETQKNTNLELLEYASKFTENIIIAEGNINSKAHIDFLKTYNIKGCILGEVLVNSAHPATTIQEIFF